MAVEIPVFIDIDKAFDEAAKRVPAASAPLKKSIEALNKDLSFYREGMMTFEINSPEFKEAARSFQKVSEAIATARTQIVAFTTNAGSIRQMNAYLAELNRQWDEMAAKDKFTAGGKLTAEAQKLKADYQMVSAEIKKTGQSLAQIVAEEERLLTIKDKSTQKRKYENAILASTVKSMKVLQEQERILSERLSTTRIGSSKYGQLKTQLQGVRAEIAKINADVSSGLNPALAQTDSRIVTLLKNSIRLVALHASLRFVRNIREVTAEFELQKVALGSIIQDTERAEELFNKLKAAAIQSPFQIKDLVSYTKQLSAYQIETDKLYDTTMKLADVSAGLGVDMGRLILAYGQVRAAAVLRGQELRQFTEAGIPLVEKLAKKFSDLRGETVKTGEVFQLISERAVPFKMIAEIFDDMTNAGGIFYKMQEKQAQTLAGQWSNLKDALSIMYDEIGNTKPVYSAMETLIQLARSMALNWEKWWKVIKVAGAGLTAYYGIVAIATIRTKLLSLETMKALGVESQRTKNLTGLTTAILGQTAAEKLATLQKKLYTTAIIGQALATNVLTKSLWGLAAAMASTGIGGLIVAAGVLVGLFTTLSNKTRNIDKDIQNATASINEMSKARTETAELIDSYEELSSKTDLTVEESKKLRDISKELAKTFPKATEGINEQTGALVLNTEKLREYNEEAQKALVKGMEAQIRVNKESIEKNNAEIEKLTQQNTQGKKRQMKWWAPWSPIIKTSLSDEQLASNAERMTELEKKNRDLIKSNEDLQDSIDNVTKKEEGNEEQLLSWQSKLIEFNSTVDKEGKNVRIFTDEQIKGYTSLSDALDDLAKEYKKEAEASDILTNALKDKNGEEAKDIALALTRTNARKDLIKSMLDYYNSFNLTQKKNSGGAAKTDPFITTMQERIKFMQDFKKGYDDLKKYMTDNQALAEEAGIMLGRGKSLGMDAAEQSRAAKDISQWYTDMIEKVQAEMRKKGIKGTSVNDFLGIDTSKKSKAVQDLQKLLQQLWDAKTDYDVSNKKRELEDALKKLSEEIKQSETARNFYQDIFDLTGDQKLATDLSISVYGDVGAEFKERIQKQLNEALAQIDASEVPEELNRAFANQDFSTILKYLDKFPEAWRERLREMAQDNQKYNADIAKNLVQALQKAKTYGEKRVDLAHQTAKRTAEIESMNIKPDVKTQLLKQNAKKEAEESAKLAYEAFKDTPMYIELFADLDAASSRMLTNMRKNLEEMKDNWKDLSPREIKELQSRINELDEQIARRNPFKALIDSVKEYRALQKERARSEADEAVIAAQDKVNAEEDLLSTLRREYDEAVELYGIDSDIAAIKDDELRQQAQIVDKAREEADAAQEAANKYRELAKHISDAAKGMQEWAGYVTDSMEGIGEIVETFASDEAAETFNILAEGLGKTLSGAAKTAEGLGRVLAGDLSGLVPLIQGVGDMIAGTFGTKNKLKIRDIDKQLERQEDLLASLDRSYNKLDKAIAKAFGSDYIYNYTQQLENLYAQQEAYQKQANLERQKGKKKDEKKIKEYEQSAEDLGDQIEEMQGQLSEFFSGTDVTSAAQDFANSWIEAYKQFGSTTDAMREKFRDMIENMITQSLAGKVMQEMLQPIFNEIDSLAQDGELTAAEIAAVADMANEKIPLINDAMTNLMNQLAASGTNVRKQVGSFTGISRDIATASEESILGLAAGVNTANFYMSQIPTIGEHVAAIREYLVGDTTNGRKMTRAAEEGPSYQDQMLMYAAYMPQMSNDVSAVRSLLDKVIKPIGVNATHYVAIQ